MIPSEREVAEVLNELHVEWQYEPQLFELAHDAEGGIKEGFRPDFYLPKFDIYVEVTQGKQPHVTRKHRKARKTMEMYPDVRVEFIYRVHFQDLKTRVLEILAIGRGEKPGEDFWNHLRSPE